MMQRNSSDSTSEVSVDDLATEIIARILDVSRSIDKSTGPMSLPELTRLAAMLVGATIIQMKRSRRGVVSLGIAWKCTPARGTDLKLSTSGEFFFVVNYVQHPVTLGQICVDRQQVQQLIDQLAMALLQAARGNQATYL